MVYRNCKEETTANYKKERKCQPSKRICPPYILCPWKTLPRANCEDMFLFPQITKLSTAGTSMNMTKKTRKEEKRKGWGIRESWLECRKWDARSTWKELISQLPPTHALVPNQPRLCLSVCRLIFSEFQLVRRLGWTHGSKKKPFFPIRLDRQG